jgi:hypothetical protein
LAENSKKLDISKTFKYIFHINLQTMKSYKHLFRKGFIFNGKVYSNKYQILNYYNLVKDILEGTHGEVPETSKLDEMFKSTVCLEYDDLPKSVKDNKTYKELGDIYVLANMGKKRIKESVERISKQMNKEVIIR